MRRNQDWDLLLSRHRTSGNAVWVCLLLEVPRLGTRCGVSESEGVIIKALVSLSRTLLPPLRSLWLAHSSGQEEVGRGTRGNRCQHCLCMRRGLTLLRATVSFIYGAACQQAECASAAGPHLALCGSHGVCPGLGALSRSRSVLARTQGSCCVIFFVPTSDGENWQTAEMQ